MSRNSFRKKTIIKNLAKLAVILFVVTILYPLYKYFNTTSEIVMYHGPYFNDNKIPSDHYNNTVLGEYTPLSNKSAKSNYVKGRNLGIAAGGGLVYLDENELDLYFSKLQELGVEWVRWDFDWNVIQPIDKSSYSWDAIDRVVKYALKHNVKTLGIITYTPKWARDTSCLSKFTCVPKNIDDFAEFAGQVSARYKNEVFAWEIWNEPNIPLFFSPKPDVNKYYEILRKSSLEIKKNNSRSIVISGGLAPSGDSYVDGSLSPLTFIKRLYKLGFSQYIDAVGLHPYTYPHTPDSIVYWNGWKEMLEIRRLMQKNNDSSKKIWITEYGASTGGPGKMNESNSVFFTYGNDFMSEKSQSEMISMSLDQFVLNKEWIETYFWYSLRDLGTSNSTPENFFGLLRHDWTKKPSYTIFKSYIDSSFR